MLLLQLAAASNYSASQDFSSADPAIAAGVIGIIVVFFVIYFVLIAAITAVYFWAIGNLLQAALGIDKWNVLWLLVPFANIYMLIKWGMEASKKNKGLMTRMNNNIVQKTSAQSSGPPSPVKPA